MAIITYIPKPPQWLRRFSAFLLHTILLNPTVRVCVFQWPFRGLAFGDLMLVIFEVIAVRIMIIRIYLVIIESGENLLRQRLEFLGGCTVTRSRPAYSASRILLNRSVGRPLVRGESRVILFARAVIISCIALGIPAFGFYSVVFKPFTGRLFNQYPSTLFSDVSGPEAPPGAATLILTRFDFSFNFYDPSAYYGELQVRAVTTFHEDAVCNITSTAANSGFVQCPYGWENISNISISLPIPSGTAGIFVTPAQGSLDVPGVSNDLGLHFLTSPDIVTRGVPLIAGSRVAAAFTWTRRDVFLPLAASVLSHPTPIFSPDIAGLQPYASNWDVGPAVATLTLFQPSSSFTKYTVETVSSTVLEGISTIGGFWTFLNGAFTLIFGANILYFAFGTSGRRPLSALGLAHIFQRTRLERQWHEDFPAIHTEGGLPGSESAGIVTFIRERLVDLGEDPRTAEGKDSDDIEAQTAEEVDERHPLDNVPAHMKTLGSAPGYIPDETPLLDMNRKQGDSSDTTIV
ncbi:hypothetical protein C8R46DRAFT_1033825 [Mycena filopes]|nr:hypothetical protein C8R46DRAFT_1033825 [Mycena filopes]